MGLPTVGNNGYYARRVGQRAISEAQLQDAIVDCARAFGFLAYHTHDSRHSAKGFPDLVLVRPPVFMVVELKVDDNVLSPAQLTWRQALEACGIEYREWREQDWLSGAIDAELRACSAVRRTA